MPAPSSSAVPDGSIPPHAGERRFGPPEQRSFLRVLYIGRAVLVATLTSQRNTSFTAPTGWVRAAGVSRANAEAEIWYYADNPGGISSASFSSSGATATAGQLSEWSGVATSSPVDK